MTRMLNTLSVRRMNMRNVSKKKPGHLSEVCCRTQVVSDTTCVDVTDEIIANYLSNSCEKCRDTNYYMILLSVSYKGIHTQLNLEEERGVECRDTISISFLRFVQEVCRVKPTPIIFTARLQCKSQVGNHRLQPGTPATQGVLCLCDGYKCALDLWYARSSLCIEVSQKSLSIVICEWKHWISKI